MFKKYLGNSNVRWGSFELDSLAEMRFEDGEQERFGIVNGDLIVCEGGEPGRCAIWREQLPDMMIQKALHRIRGKEGLRNLYLFYWLMIAAKTGLLEHHFTGTTIKHLTGKALANIQIPLPPLYVQDGIISVLSILDDKIALNSKINHHLEQMAQAIFKSWFVDFEPWGGEMPEDWREAHLGSLVQIIDNRGKTPPLTPQPTEYPIT